MKPLPFLMAALAAALCTAAAATQLKPPVATDATVAAAPNAASAAPAGNDAENRAKADAGVLAASGWLVLLDRRDWGRAWETSSSVFRSTVPLGTWMDGIPKVRQPLGNLVERTPTESMYKTTLEGRPDGEYVTVIFDSKFDQKPVQELVTTVREPDGKWRVTGYSTR